MKLRRVINGDRIRVGRRLQWLELWVDAVFPVEIDHYDGSYWAVYVGTGRDLLCVCVERRDAVAVKDFLVEMLAYARDIRGDDE